MVLKLNLVHVSCPSWVEVVEGPAENLVADVGVSTSYRMPSIKRKSNRISPAGLSEARLDLRDLIRRSSCEAIQQAIDTELVRVLERCRHPKARTGRRIGGDVPPHLSSTPV